ncbi:MAG: SDR family NAD(P)-dependent oxidoreductase [Mycobacteriales bacterium]
MTEPEGAEPIAIVGMSARVPGADDIDRFWRNLVDGVESVTFFSREELLAKGIGEDVVDSPDYVPAAPVLNQVEYFDAGLFGMTAREARLADPQQRLFLEQAHAALVDAGCDPVRYPGAIGVYGGSGAPEYEWLNVRRNPAAYASAGNLGVAVGNKADYLATTVSYRLNLRGPSLTLHTACSTSLVAIHLGCEALRGGECDLALAGGVCVELPHGAGYPAADGYTSGDGHCRPFDAKADGTIWGSGVGAVVLKRLSDAVADGDRIRAVVLGNAVNNDGAGKVGFSAPSVDGQAAVIAEALGVAGVDPRTIGYVEAHGTGTALGDPIEVAALTAVYGKAGTDRGWCGIGSVKSNIGHLSHAAGVVAVIKAVLALQHGTIPPTVNFEQPNPEIDFDGSPFFVASTLSRWDGDGGPRRAAVSSFGIGGTNAHVELEQAPPLPATPPSRRSAQLLQVSARTPAARDAAVRRLSDHLAATPEVDLAAVAHTLRTGRTEYPHRAAAVASDPADAVAALGGGARLATGEAADPPPPVGMLFSGQGAQYAGMGAQLYEAEPAYAAAVDECAELLRPMLGEDLRPLLLGTGDRADADARLRQTALTQPALFTVEHALAELWRSWGVRPAAMVGHSIGEYVAATVAGVFTLPGALSVVATRGRLMQSMPPGAMLAVQRGEDAVAPLLPDDLSVAVVNGPDTCVVAGEPTAVAELAERLRAERIRCTTLRTSHAFHSAMMEPILGEFAAAVAAVPRRAPGIPFLSDVSGTWITDEQATSPAYWADHLRRPVRFGDCARVLLDDGGYQLLECGPGRQLASLARMQQRGSGRPPAHSLPGASDKADDCTTIAAAAGRLWVAGVPVELGAGEPGRRVALPGYPYQREHHWVSPEAAPQTAPVARAAAGSRPVEHWAEVPVWRQLPPVAAGPAPARALVFVADPTGEAVAAGLRATGAEVVEVRPGTAHASTGTGFVLRPDRREDYDALVGALAGTGVLERVVHAWALAGDPAGTDLDAAWQAQETGLLSLLWLTQALVAGSAEPAQLDVLTAGTEDVTGSELTRPEHATVAGIARVVPLESPELRVRHVDLDADVPAEAVVAELLRAPDGEPVALRGRRRWRRSTEPAELPVADGPGGLRDRGRYLVTGGLGGVGITLAEDLATRHRARLVLLSRTGLPDRAEWDGYVAVHGTADRTGRAIAAIRRIEAAGAEVLAVAADVTDPAALQHVRAEVEARFGGLDGIVHAAGLPGGGMAEVRQRDAAVAVLAPKLAGTLALQQAFGDLALDAVVLCSSVTALSGGFGQVDYCAANAFLDAYARSGHGWPARVVSVDWGGWRDVGMAAETAVPDAFRALHADPAVTPLDHPLLTGRRPDGTCVGTLSAAGSWVLDEHRIAGVPVLPGTAHLECLRAAGGSGGTGTVELRDVAFVAPLSVPDGAEAELRVEPLGGGGFRLVTGTVLHSRGSARPVRADEPPAVDLAAIRSRCRPRDRTGESARVSTVAFGPHWDCLREWYVGTGEELALLEAGPAAAADLARWVLHPALLDVATSFGRSRGTGSYLPLSYGRVLVRGPLPARCWSHLRYQDPDGTDAAEVVTADVTVLDDAGRELVAITDFVLRRVDPDSVSSTVSTQAAAGAGAQPAAGAPARPAAEPGGIAPADGAEAFRRLLAADLGPQVVLSAVPLADVVARERRLTAVQAADGPAAGGTEVAVVPDGAAPRGELERMLAETWGTVLGVPAVGPDDDFFDLGGNSLVAVQLVARVREAAGVRLPMRTLFDAPTVAGMAARIEQLRAAAADAGTEPDSSGAIPRLARPGQGGTP